MGRVSDKKLLENRKSTKRCRENLGILATKDKSQHRKKANALRAASCRYTTHPLAFGHRMGHPRQRGATLHAWP